MTYRAPANDMLLALNHGAGPEAAVKAGIYADFDSDITAAVLEEAGRFASDVLAPLNRVGDENSIQLEANKVITAPGDDRQRRSRQRPRRGAAGVTALVKHPSTSENI